MLDALYRRRLERDLEIWRDQGLVTSESAEEILESIGDDGRPRTAVVVGFLGAVLIAVGAILFIGANWEEITRPLRLALLVGGMAICYGFAALQSRANHPWFADAAIFAGASLFGAAIILVAQSYHISGDYPDALLLWGGGAFFAAVLGPSRAALALSLGVLSLWFWYEILDFGWIFHWPSLIALALIGTVASAWMWRAGIHLTVLALGGWIGVTVVSGAIEQDWSAVASTCLGLSVALLLFALGHFLGSRRHRRWPRAVVFGPVLGIYALFGFLALLIVLQFAVFDSGSPNLSNDRIPLIAAGLTIAVSAAFLLTTRSGLRALILGVAPLVVAGAAVGLIALGSSDKGVIDSVTMQILLGILALFSGIWAVAYGNRTGSRASATFGLIAFAGEVLYLYFVTFGTLLDTALFFLIGGILMVALAAALVRLQRRLSLSEAGEPA